MELPAGWFERGLSFGAAAAGYEEFRPEYPAEVVELVSGYAGHPVRTAVEIGAGTGKATRVFAAAGVSVTALEPDPAMLEQLMGHVTGKVSAVLGTFEEIDPDALGPVDLVFAAAALHWTDPEGRWPRIAALLKPSGVVASLGGPVELADEDLREQVREARQPHVPDDDIPLPDGSDPDAPLRWPGTEMRDSALFTDVEQVVVERRSTMPALRYLGYLSTVSAYLVLPAHVRSLVLSRIGSVLPDQVDLVADLTLHLARLARDGGQPAGATS